MTDTQPALDRPPFAALVAELAELGFDTEPHASPGPRQFAAPDSTLTVTVDDSQRPPRAVLTSGENEPAWEITLRGEVPDAAQLVTLYAALHPQDAAAASHAIDGAAPTR